jgi:Tfp pilus assembly protein PilZ
VRAAADRKDIVVAETNDVPADERRRFPRVREDCIVKFRRVDRESFAGPAREGVTHNISGGGICFRSRERFEVGETVALDLRLPEFGSSIIALGRVVRCDDGGEGNEAAVEFLWVGWSDDDAQRAIADYIRRKLGDRVS